MWMLGWRSLLVSMSTRRASAKARKVQRPSRLTVVMRANTVAHEPVASMRYPEKYTMRTPAEGDKVAVMLALAAKPDPGSALKHLFLRRRGAPPGNINHLSHCVRV